MTSEQKMTMVAHSLKIAHSKAGGLELPEGWDQPIVFKAQLQQSRKISTSCVFTGDKFYFPVF